MFFSINWLILVGQTIGHIFSNDTFLIFFTVIITGIIAAEARLALEILHLHQRFNLHTLGNDVKKEITKKNFRFRRYVIGITTAFIAIVSLAYTLQPLNQAVIGLIAALSGNVFLTKQIDGDIEKSLDLYLQRSTRNTLEELELSIEESDFEEDNTDENSEEENDDESQREDTVS